MPNADAQEAAALRSLLVRYIRHVQVCEGVDYIDSCRHFDDASFTESEWSLLESLAKEARQPDRPDPKETK
jgi:hypothetical protein